MVGKPFRVALLTALVSVLALSGCGGGDDETTSATEQSAETTPAAQTPPAGGTGQDGASGAGVYVGTVEGTDASIALVTDGGRLSGAFLCIPESTSQWIRPSAFKGTKAPLVARRGIVLGSAKFAAGGATGTISVGGDNPFTAELATGEAGLYRTTTGNADQPGFSETGWIVLSDGDVCGSTSTITSDGGFKSEEATSDPEGQITNFSDPFPF